MVPIFVVCSI